MTESKIDNFTYRLETYNSNKNINIHDKHILSLYYTDSSGFSCILSYLYINSFTDAIDYICIGNNIISRDGSYMANFIKVEDLSIIPSVLIEKTKLFLMKYKNKLSMKTSYLDKTISQHSNIDLDSFDKLFIFSLYIIITNYFSNYLYERLEELNSIKKLWDSNIRNKINIPQDVKSKIISFTNLFGQKILPEGYYYEEDQLIKYRDFSNEININYIMSKETFKKSTPAYPILMEYLSLDNVNYNIWDNDSIKNKLYESRKIKKKVSNKIFIMINEHCGDTLINYLKEERNIIGDLKNDELGVQCFIFQIIHAVGILHSKDYIHGDLHINNITIRQTYKTKKIGVSNADKSLFLISAEKDIMYFIKFYGAYATILDFGRSLNVKDLLNQKSYFYNKLKSIIGNDFDIGINNNVYIKCCMIMDIYKFIESFYYLSSIENYKTSVYIEKFKKVIVKFIIKIISGAYDEEKNSNISMIFIRYSNMFLNISANKDKILNFDQYVDVFNC